MANCGSKFYINYLKSEYGVSRCGPEDLVKVLESVKHTLNTLQLKQISESNKLQDVDDLVLLEAATAIYVRQQFK